MGLSGESRRGIGRRCFVRKPRTHHRLLALVSASLLLVGPLAPAHAADCNNNGVPDADDIAAGTSEDCN